MDEAEADARDELKSGLARLPAANQRIFKLMYANDSRGCTNAQAAEMDINELVDAMGAEKLEWAMQQVANTLRKALEKRDGCAS